MTQVAEWLDHHHIDVVTIVGTAAILIVAAIIILVLSRLLQLWLSYLQGRLHLTDETNLTIGRIVVAVLWIFTAFAVLNVWGVGLGGVWAVLVSAITVIGVGFPATWAMISNFTASFFLALWRPFYFGQTVEILIFAPAETDSLQRSYFFRVRTHLLARTSDGAALRGNRIRRIK